MKNWLRIMSVALMAGALLGACSGDDGATGATGATGAPGAPGAPGPAGPPGPGVIPPPATADGDLTGTIQSIAVDSAAAQTMTVTFSLKNSDGLPVTGATNFEFTVAKLIPATTSTPAYWQSYINRSVLETGGARVLRAAGERRVATEVEPGLYRYTFCTPLAAVASFKYYGSGTEPAGSCATAAVGRSGVLASPAAGPILAALDLAYAPNATHRVAIASRNAGSLRPRFNAVMDFVPASLPNFLAAKAAQVVTNESCGACHAQNSTKRGKLEFASFHGGTRYDVALCSTCHNPGTYDSESSTDTAWTAIDLTTMIHKLHAGAAGYSVAGRDYSGLVFTQNAPFGGVGAIGAGWNGGVAAPGVINCRTCHDNQNPLILPQQPVDRAAADKVAWEQNISQQACGSCHNGSVAGNVDFSNHFGNQPGNEQCALCHGPGRSVPVPAAHATPYSLPNNPELVAGAAKVEYEIASVQLNASQQPTVNFRVKVDGQPVNLKSLPAGITIGAVNMRLAWSAPMPAPAIVTTTSGPAIAAPLDWNNFGTTAGRQHWDNTINLQTGTTTGVPGGTALTQAAFDQPPGVNLSAILGSLVGPDQDGYFTTVAGIAAAPLAFPANATLKGVAIESYLTINAMNISGVAVMKGVDGSNTLRRKVVDTQLCNTCHERVGFHSNGGRWANADYCATCHNPELNNSNVFSGLATFANAPGGGEFFYQQVSNNLKDMVHSLHAGAERKAQNPADPYNFIRGNPAGGGGNGPYVFQDFVYPMQVSDCKSCHLSTATTNTYGLPANDRYAWSVIDAQPALGTVASFNPANSVRVGPSQAACGSCHNSTSAKAHFVTFTTPGAEGCATCHGAGKIVEGHK